jgi:hypothetical protein
MYFGYAEVDLIKPDGARIKVARDALLVELPYPKIKCS